MKRTLLPMAALLALAACSSSKELTCATDQRVCSSACVSLQSDAKNCGACGNVCGVGQGCSAGACVDCTTNPAACTTAVVAACFNLNQVRPLGADLSPAGPAIATDSGPIGFATLAGKLYVANDTASTVSALTLAPPGATTGAAALQVPSQGATYPDVGHLAAHGGLLWASNAGTGNLVVLDPARAPASAVVREIVLAESAGEYVNPQGVDFVGDVAYVALAGPGAVAVVDTAAATLPQPLPRIDVSRFATGTASASPSRVLATGGKVYVTLNDIIDQSYKQVPGANGKLVVIDPATNTVVGAALDLGPDCLDAGPVALVGTTLWIGCGYYDFTSVHGAGLVPVSIAGAAPVAGPIVKTTSGIDALAVCGGKGYAGAVESGTVLAFDATTGAVASSSEACPAGAQGSFVADLACAP